MNSIERERILTNKIEIENEFKKLKEDNFRRSGWLDDNVFQSNVNIPKKLQKLLNCNVSYLTGRYFYNEKTFKYFLNTLDEDSKTIHSDELTMDLDYSILNTVFAERIRNY